MTQRKTIYDVLKILSRLDPKRMYRRIEIVDILLSEGFTYNSAHMFIRQLAKDGFLIRVIYGAYYINLDKIKKEIEEIERKKEKIKEKIPA